MASRSANSSSGPSASRPSSGSRPASTSTRYLSTISLPQNPSIPHCTTNASSNGTLPFLQTTIFVSPSCTQPSRSSPPSVTHSAPFSTTTTVRSPNDRSSKTRKSTATTPLDSARVKKRLLSCAHAASPSCVCIVASMCGVRWRLSCESEWMRVYGTRTSGRVASGGQPAVWANSSHC